MIYCTQCNENRAHISINNMCYLCNFQATSRRVVTINTYNKIKNKFCGVCRKRDRHCATNRMCYLCIFNAKKSSNNL